MRAILRRGDYPDRARGSRGQTLIIFAFFFVGLIGVVGLATDGGVGFFYSVQVERAAAAAALAGVPYMPANPATAQTRALAEAARNGFTNANSTISFPATASGQFRVKIVTQAPTYFMQALGVGAYNVTRIAEAGYRPPISLGQPNAQLGSTLSQLSGGGGNFYFMRFKGWNNDRSEGDAFTPNPSETGNNYNGKTGSLSSDVHLISQAAANEDAEVSSADAPGGSAACSGATTTAFALPCRGGYNYRIVVPSTVPAKDIEIDVYNMAFAPNFGSKTNACENTKNWTTCNASGYNYAEQDSGGSACTSAASCAGQTGNYLATEYSVFNVPDVFLRTNDQLLTQTKVLPVDATNWDCNTSTKGAGNCSGTTDPSYVDLNTGGRICQQYTTAASTTVAAASNNQTLPQGTINVASVTGFSNGNNNLAICTPGGWDQVTCTATATGPARFTGCTGGSQKMATGLAVQLGAADGAAPTNMLIYHSWADAVNYTGGGDVDTSGNRLVTHTYANTAGCTSSPCSVNGGTGNGLGPGTYRLRADALAYDGSIGTTQKGSKGYAVRAIHKGTGALCTECTVAAWQDMCIFSPVGAASAITQNNPIPLFELPKEYAGSTINVDIFDVGDGGDDGSGLATNDVGLIDPRFSALFTNVSGVPISNLGISESGSPAVDHVPGQTPIPAPLGTVANQAANTAVYRSDDQAGYVDAKGNHGQKYQGSWVRTQLAVPSTYAPSAFPFDFWNLQYSLTHINMNDTFTLSVNATGGPVRLITG